MTGEKKTVTPGLNLRNVTERQLIHTCTLLVPWIDLVNRWRDDNDPYPYISDVLDVCTEGMRIFTGIKEVCPWWFEEDDQLMNPYEFFESRGWDLENEESYRKLFDIIDETMWATFVGSGLSWYYKRARRKLAGSGKTLELQNERRELLNVINDAGRKLITTTELSELTILDNRQIGMMLGGLGFRKRKVWHDNNQMWMWVVTSDVLEMDQILAYPPRDIVKMWELDQVQMRLSQARDIGADDLVAKYVEEERELKAEVDRLAASLDERVRVKEAKRAAKIEAEKRRVATRRRRLSDKANGMKNGRKITEEKSIGEVMNGLTFI